MLPFQLQLGPLDGLKVNLPLGLSGLAFLSLLTSSSTIHPCLPPSLGLTNWMPLDTKPPVEHCSFSVTFQLLQMVNILNFQATQFSRPKIILGFGFVLQPTHLGDCTFFFGYNKFLGKSGTVKVSRQSCASPGVGVSSTEQLRTSITKELVLNNMEIETPIRTSLTANFAKEFCRMKINVIWLNWSWQSLAR